MPAEPRSGRCRGSCAGFPRCCSAPGGRLRRHHEEESRGAGERAEGTFCLLPAPRSPEERVCPWPALSAARGAVRGRAPGAPVAPVLEPRARGLRGRREVHCEKEGAPAPGSARWRSRGELRTAACAQHRPGAPPGWGLCLSWKCPIPIPWTRGTSYSVNRS